MTLPDAMDLVAGITEPGDLKAVPQYGHRVAIRQVLRSLQEALKIAEETSRAADVAVSRIARA